MNTVGVGEANVFAVVVGEIEVVLAEWIFDPVGDAYEGGAVYFGP